MKTCRRCEVRRLLRLLILVILLEHGSEIFSGIQGSIGFVRGIGRGIEAGAEAAEEFFRGLGFEPESESEVEVVLGDKTVVG